MQRKSRGLFTIALCLVAYSFNSFASAGAFKSAEHDPKLSVHEAAALHGFRSMDHWSETATLPRLTLTRANSNSSPISVDSDSDSDEDESRRSAAIIKKKSIAKQVRAAIRAQSPLAEVLNSEKAYAKFYLASPKSALRVCTSSKDGSKTKIRLTASQIALEEQRLKAEIAKRDIHKDLLHKEEEMLAKERDLLRTKAEFALLKKQAAAASILKAQEESDLQKMNVMFALIKSAACTPIN